jgi:hypothetical protein
VSPPRRSFERWNTADPGELEELAGGGSKVAPLAEVHTLGKYSRCCEIAAAGTLYPDQCDYSHRNQPAFPSHEQKHRVELITGLSIPRYRLWGSTREGGHP